MSDQTVSRPGWGVLIVVGLIGGLLSGAFGVGGGVVMVPLLLLLARMDEREASATSLSAVFPASIVGSIGYLLHGQVDLLAAAALAVGGIPGALLGASLVRRIPVGLLRWLFIALLTLVAVRTLVSPNDAIGGHHSQNWITLLALVGVGVLTGLASGLFGVGGGIIVIPALTIGFGFVPLVAKGTSLAMMIVSSGTGTASHLRHGTIQWRSSAIVAAAAIVASYGGVLLALTMSSTVSQVLFGLLLVATVIQLTVRAIRLRAKAAVV
ncbi:MAG: permease [Microbacteriaceae bacterium]|nr:permease [Microbacteriaceae bacterium]